MNEKLKAKVSKFKILAKKHGPAVLGGIGTIVATAVAVHYRNRVIRYETVDPDAWPTFEVHPDVYTDVVEHGATMKLRMFTNGDREYVQHTTLDEFPAEAEELKADFLGEKLEFKK
jgi:hypothetical protein